MRKYCHILTFIVLAVFALPFFTGYAEWLPQLEINASISPETFVTTDEADVSFTLTNYAGQTLERICLTALDGALIDNIGDLGADDSVSYTLRHTLTQQELEKTRLEFYVTCVMGRDHYSYPVEIPFTRVKAAPEVEFLRRTNASLSAATGEVTVSYEVVNVGNVDVRDLRIRDEAGDYQDALDLLTVGQRYTFQQKFVVDDETVSAPVLTFYAADVDDETAYSIALDDQELTPVYGGLSGSLTVGHSLYASDSADVILRLENTGNSDYQSITVYDDVYGGVIADGFSFFAGQPPMEISRTYPIRGNISCRWSVMARSSNGGIVSFVTNTVDVPTSLRAQPASLVLSVQTDTQHISRAGLIDISFEISNTGSSDVTNVLIREETDGDICPLAVVPTGEPFVFTRKYRVAESRELVFTASWLDSSGDTHTVTAAPLPITIGRGGAEPSAMASDLLTGRPIKQSSFDIIPVLLLVSVAILLVLLIVLVVSSRRERFNRKVREAARRQQLMGNTGRIPRTGFSPGNTGRIPRVSGKQPAKRHSRKTPASSDNDTAAKTSQARTRRENDKPTGPK